MTLFILGFIFFWVIFAVLQLFAEKHDWFCKDWYVWATTAPISIPVAMVLFLFKVIYHPWRNVIHSVPRGALESELVRGRIKAIHIGRFYICYEKAAKPINKIFFARVEKGLDK
jgi:hypothetical protein